MPSILISRFIINLRQLDKYESEGATGITEMPAGRFSQFSVPNFRVPTMDDVVGNMGEPLEHGWEARDDGELETESQEVPPSDEEARRGDRSEIEEIPRSEAGPLTYQSDCMA